jgi:hypothetical protein
MNNAGAWKRRTSLAPIRSSHGWEGTRRVERAADTRMGPTKHLPAQVSVQMATAQTTLHPEMDTDAATLKHAPRVAADDGAQLCAVSVRTATGCQDRIGDCARPELWAPDISAGDAAADRLSTRM